jgi:glutathione S-transferase
VHFRGLLPRGAQDEFRAISLLAWCASGIHPALTPNALPQRYCDLPGSEDSVRRCAQKLLMENYQIAENLLKRRDWFLQNFTLADAYFFWCLRRGLPFGVDMSGLPNCRGHFHRCRFSFMVALFAFHGGTRYRAKGAEQRLIPPMNSNMQQTR